MKENDEQNRDATEGIQLGMNGPHQRFTRDPCSRTHSIIIPVLACELMQDAILLYRRMHQASNDRLSR